MGVAVGGFLSNLPRTRPVAIPNINGDVGIFVVLNFENESCVLKSLYIRSSYSYSYLARVSYVSIRISFIYLFLACALLLFNCSYLY
jgi:hypothetical protein